jgi:hypothetical protein
MYSSIDNTHYEVQNYDIDNKMKYIHMYLATQPIESKFSCPLIISTVYFTLTEKAGLIFLMMDSSSLGSSVSVTYRMHVYMSI